MVEDHEVMTANSVQALRMKPFFDLLAADLSQTLTLLLRMSVETFASEGALVGWTQASAADVGHTCFVLLEVGANKARGVICLSFQLAHYLVDRVLGGAGPLPETPDRDLTGLERRLLTSSARRIAHDLEIHLSKSTPTRVEVVGIEDRPDMVGMPPGSPGVLEVKFHVQTQESLGDLRLVLPADSLDQMPLPRTTGDSLAPELATLGTVLGDTMVECEVVIDGSKIIFQDLQNLKPGTVLVLEKAVDRPAHLVLNDSIRLSGELRARGDELVFQMALD